MEGCMKKLLLSLGLICLAAIWTPTTIFAGGTPLTFTDLTNIDLTGLTYGQGSSCGDANYIAFRLFNYDKTYYFGERKGVNKTGCSYGDGNEGTNNAIMMDILAPYGNLNIISGDHITITYSGGQTLDIYLPALYIAGGYDPNHVPYNLYIGNDGSTYWDQNLTSLGGFPPPSKTWYQDYDGDGYGNPNILLTSVSQPYGYVSDKTDCNDNDATIHPNAAEIAGDNIDQDCDGADLQVSKTWYQDYDGDGYGDSTDSQDAATQPAGYVSDKTDCDDTDATINPGATEIAGDGIDQDCDGKDLTANAWYKDSDGDGYGDSTDSQDAATQPTGYVSDKTDCDDTDATINPGATEIAGDGIDQDCDGKDLTANAWYKDSDGDGYGDSTDSQDAATQPTGYVSDKTDCDDTDATINPGATEIAGDGIDQDCDGKDLTATSVIEQISLISPTDNQTLSFGATNGGLVFSFSKIANATKFKLYIELYDLSNNTTIPLVVDLISQGNGTQWNPVTPATQGFTESVVGMTYSIILESTTWDSLALNDIKWGVEAYNEAGTLIGSTYESSTPAKYVNSFIFMASTAVAMTSPSPGSIFIQSQSVPIFKWDLYSGVANYELVLAKVSGASFSPVLNFPGLILNLLTMDNPTWQSMPAGKWYWTVLGYDSLGNQTPSKFTVFDFEVK
jgi:hypothetical protein